MTTIASDPELDALRAVIAADLPAYLADLEHLVNIDCGSYTPAGVDEVGAWTGRFLEGLGRDRRASAGPRRPVRRHGRRHVRGSRRGAAGPAHRPHGHGLRSRARRPPARSASRTAWPTGRASPT